MQKNLNNKEMSCQASHFGTYENSITIYALVTSHYPYNTNLIGHITLHNDFHIYKIFFL